MRANNTVIIGFFVNLFACLTTKFHNQSPQKSLTTIHRWRIYNQRRTLWISFCFCFRFQKTGSNMHIYIHLCVWLCFPCMSSHLNTFSMFFNQNAPISHSHVKFTKTPHFLNSLKTSVCFLAYWKKRSLWSI